jgi:hypothetical protein
MYSEPCGLEKISNEYVNVRKIVNWPKQTARRRVNTAVSKSKPLQLQ